LVVATLPFSFEGRRRREQAFAGINALRACSDLVICFENERMSSIAGTSAGVLDAFAAVDALLAQAVRSLSAMTRRRNVLSGGIAEIAAAVGGSSATALFGFGIAEGENRGAGALARALESPLLDKGSKLKEATSLWVHVAGGDDMRWAEVQSLMAKASEMTAQDVKMFFGASVDASLVGTIAITLIAGVPDACEPVFADLVHSSGNSRIEPDESKNLEYPPVAPEGRSEQHEALRNVQARKSVSVPPFERKQESHADTGYIRQIPVAPVVNELVNGEEPSSEIADKLPVEAELAASAPEVEVTSEKIHPQESEVFVPSQLGGEAGLQAGAPVVTEPEGAIKKKETVQEQMSFEPVSRGRFEKTDPTIVDGEDLDIPTFMRQRRD
jgi:cell division protein FtsZ